MISTRSGKMTSPDVEVLRPRAGAAVVVLTGEHDLATRDGLHEVVFSLLETQELVVADLSTVQFVDSSTLGVLVSAERQASAAGKQFRLQLGTEPIVRRILEISGLLSILDCYPTRDEALAGPGPEKQPDRLL
jgi:anti-anti-sigma factor